MGKVKRRKSYPRGTGTASFRGQVSPLVDWNAHGYFYWISRELPFNDTEKPNGHHWGWGKVCCISDAVLLFSQLPLLTPDSRSDISLCTSCSKSTLSTHSAHTNQGHYFSNVYKLTFLLKKRERINHHSINNDKYMMQIIVSFALLWWKRDRICF